MEDRSLMDVTSRLTGSSPPGVTDSGCSDFPQDDSMVRAENADTARIKSFFIVNSFRKNNKSPSYLQNKAPSLEGESASFG